MSQTNIRFTCFPRTKPPPEFVPKIIEVFRACESDIGTLNLAKGLTSNEVLARLRPSLKDLGFAIEEGKLQADKIDRPVFYGENGIPILNYQIDAYSPEWRCGLEIEAGRGLEGNAIYRDLIQALVMANVDFLVLAVAINYKRKSNGKAVISKDYDKAVAVANALYGHSRMRLPYDLTIIGY
jgi:hypothetical protein